MSRRRKYLWLSLPLLVLVLLWVLLYSNWGLTLGLRLLGSALPGQLTVGQHQGSLLGPIMLRDVRYRDDRVKLSLRQLDLKWQASALFAGKLHITQLAVADVELNLPARKARTQAASSSSALVLPLGIELQQASVKHLQIRSAATAKPVAIESVQLAAQLKRQRLQIDRFQVNAYRSEAKASGEMQLRKDLPLALKVAFHYQPKTGKTLNGSGELKGNLRKLRLSQKISGMLSATLEAQASDLLAGLHWQGKLNLTRLNLQDVIANSPSVTALGSIRANGNSKHLQAQSELQLDNKRIGLTQLQLQANSDLAFKAYHVQANGDFIGLQLPSAKLAFEANGDHRQLTVSQLQVQTLKGHIQGQARFDWQPQVRVDAKLALRDLHTGEFARQWPGKFSAELALRSEASGKDWPLHFSLSRLKGELRGYPLKGEVDGRWAKQQLTLRSLQLNVGGTRVSAQGQLAKNWDLQFEAASDDLTSLSPSLHGHFKLNGRLGGTAKAPTLSVNGEAGQLAYAQNAVASLNLQLALGLAPQARSNIELTASDVRTRTGQWNTLQLETRGRTDAHTINLTAKSDTGSLHTQLHGSFKPWRWTGILNQFELNHAHYGTWHLQEPAALTLARNRYTSSPFCLVQEGTHLCVQGLWSRDQRLATLNIKALPLRLLQPWLPRNIQLAGKLDAEAEIHTTQQGAIRAKLAVHSPDRSVALKFVDLNEQLTLAATSLTAKLDDKGLHANLHLPLSAGGGVTSELALPGWSPQQGLPRSQNLRASLKLDRVPADIITRFVPETARAKGLIHADLHVTGSLGEPRLHGDAGWQGGSVLVPQLGINIREVSAEVKSTQTNTVAFTIKARSGDGDVQLEGHTRLNPTQGWPTQATLTSHNLEVSNTPEAFILVDSQVKVALQGNTIHVEGDITVPRARLHPHGLPEGAVPLSPDVVIVHGDKQTAVATRWLLSAHLRVKLGDQVDFNGFGIRGKLRGNLVLNDEPGKLVMGQGEVSIVDGVYRLRGQDLTIRRGRLIFSNTFIDDPALDVEAVRVVNTVTAGVRLKGTLKQPQLTIFSEPSMSESDALSYLLLGHAFSQSTLAEGQSVSNAASALGFVAGDYLAKGLGGELGLDELRVAVNQTTQNTSLVIGKYLSPKLYLRYYTGIAESSRIIQLQYQLSRRVQIQTESGYRGTQSVSGGDIFFTVEY